MKPASVDAFQLNPIAKAAFGLASITFEVRAHYGVSRAEVTLGIQLLKEQNQYDQMPADLFSQLERILFFADKVADDIVCEETEILEKTIPRMFEVMQKVATFSCKYVKRGFFGKQSPFLHWKVLMVAERTLRGLVHGEMIEDMGRNLTEVIEDFDRAVNIEALRLVKETGKHSLSQQYTILTSLVQSRSFCLGGSNLSRPAIIKTFAAWKAPENLSSIKF